MRRIALLFVITLFSAILSAQPGRPRPEDLSDEEFIRMQSRDMAGWLNLEGETKDKFITTYAAFRGEINTLADKAKPAVKADTEEEIDKTMQMNFEISGKILEIRKRYYAEFKKFLQPSQIRQMYRFESEAGRRMHGGPDRPDGPGRHGEPEHHGEPRQQGGPEYFRMGPPI